MLGGGLTAAPAVATTTTVVAAAAIDQNVRRRFTVASFRLWLPRFFAGGTLNDAPAPRAVPVEPTGRALEPLLVGDVDRVRRERDDARFRRERPAALLVVAARIPVLLERPELGEGVAPRAQPLERMVVQRGADTGVPVRGDDIERAQESVADRYR